MYYRNAAKKGVAHFKGELWYRPPNYYCLHYVTLMVFWQPLDVESGGICCGGGYHTFHFSVVHRLVAGLCTDCQWLVAQGVFCSHNAPKRVIYNDDSPWLKLFVRQQTAQPLLWAASYWWHHSRRVSIIIWNAGEMRYC